MVKPGLLLRQLRVLRSCGAAAPLYDRSLPPTTKRNLQHL